jgi:acetyl esterase/lipase
MKRITFTFAANVAFVAFAIAADPQRIPLWEHGGPGMPTTKAEHEPALFLYRAVPQNVARSAVIICPGGGYAHLAMDHEGKQIAEWFNNLGITAFVLQYRNNSSGHRHPVPMNDGQRAIRTVRARVDEWKVDPAKIGVMGFSAGGHLASTLGTHFDAGQSDAEDPIERTSSRPDFLILCYPVISMTEAFMHRGSRDNLLGKDAVQAQARSLSNELHVTAQTPPTFIFQTDADQSVPAENCVVFYLALRRAGVPAELHIYQDGRHGVGLARDLPATSTWPDRLRDWLLVRGMIDQMK